MTIEGKMCAILAIAFAILIAIALEKLTQYGFHWILIFPLVASFGAMGLTGGIAWADHRKMKMHSGPWGRRLRTARR